MKALSFNTIVKVGFVIKVPMPIHGLPTGYDTYHLNLLKPVDINVILVKY